VTGDKVVCNQGLPTVLPPTKKADVQLMPPDVHPGVNSIYLYINAPPATTLHEADDVAAITVYVHLCRIHMTNTQLHDASSFAV
jgi:hypothetical protein